MKKVIFSVLILVGITTMFSSCGYNSMVNKEEAVEAQWAQVEVAYQRRADLIGNLVKTVKATSDFVQKTLTDVVQARASATQVKIDANSLTPDNIQKFQQAQDGLSNALGKLLMVHENYPELSTQHFRDFMTELEGTENRIAVERRKFNEAVQDYNSYIKRFPNNMMASMFGFEKKGYFHAAAGAENAPQVDFK